MREISMLNQSADYALRAVLFLARSEAGGTRSADVIARSLGVPRNYMGKVLNALAHAGALESVRGPRGGFRLASDALQRTVASVIEPFQRLADRHVCLLGDRPCDATRPCDVHQRWRRMEDPVTAFFRHTTIAALLAPAPGGEAGRAASTALVLPAGRREAGRTEPFPTEEACT
jgi:Rrf2 family protein